MFAFTAPTKSHIPGAAISHLWHYSVPLFYAVLLMFQALWLVVVLRCACARDNRSNFEKLQCLADIMTFKENSPVPLTYDMCATQQHLGPDITMSQILEVSLRAGWNAWSGHWSAASSAIQTSISWTVSIWELVQQWQMRLWSNLGDLFTVYPSLVAHDFFDKFVILLVCTCGLALLILPVLILLMILYQIFDFLIMIVLILILFPVMAVAAVVLALVALLIVLASTLLTVLLAILSMSLSLILAIPVLIGIFIGLPFLIDQLKSYCHFGRAIWCLPVPGSDCALPLNYYVLPAYIVMWAREVLQVLRQKDRTEEDTEKETSDESRQSNDSSWMTRAWAVFPELLDAKSDLSVALNAWNVVPLIWSLLFFPTVILSFISVYVVACQKVAHPLETNSGWQILRFCEDFPQAILALWSIALFAKLGAPQDPFVVTTVLGSLVRVIVQAIRLWRRFCTAGDRGDGMKRAGRPNPLDLVVDDSVDDPSGRVVDNDARMEELRTRLGAQKKKEPRGEVGAVLAGYLPLALDEEHAVTPESTELQKKQIMPVQSSELSVSLRPL